MSTAATLAVPGFEVIQFLGNGARSTIWQVRDRQSGESFALKRVVKREPADYRFMEQVENEYEIGHQLDHEVIRHVHEIRRMKRWLSIREIHLLMEMCDGQTVATRRPGSIPEVLRIFLLVAQAAEYINSKGFVHGDIKPNNILVSDNGTVKIIDMGQSCRLGTIKQRIQGTPDFISPEQVHCRPLDGRTDMFNLGAAMYWTLTGQPIPTVLPRENSVTFKDDLVVIAAEKLNPKIPPPLSKLIHDCIEQAPSRRPPSMSEVISRLKLIAHTLRRGKDTDTPPRKSGKGKRKTENGKPKP